MPELPEVQIVCRALANSSIINVPICKVVVKRSASKQIREIDIKIFAENLRGQSIRKIRSKGKWLFFLLDSLVLANHLRMTGKFFLISNIKDDERLEIIKKNALLTFTFANEQQLVYCDSRKFGQFYLQDINNFFLLMPYKNIGPDVIQDEIKVDYLLSRFQTLRSPIKKVLLEQKIMSGIGNIYASEILFFAKINPFKPAKQITREEIEHIIHYARIILLDAINHGGSSVSDFISPYNIKGSYQQKLKVYDRANKMCYNCQTLIVAKEINCRSSFFCPNCQK